MPLPPRIFQAQLATLALLAGTAHADLVAPLQAAPIVAPGSVAFHDTDVQIGTLGTAEGAPTNFLDQWLFTLAAPADVSAIAVAIDFTDASGANVLFGITNLQLELIAANGTSWTSWLTVSQPAPGIEQVVTQLPVVRLDAGDYTLAVRGLVSGPGSYSGSLIAQNAQPPAVPLPPTLVTLGGGLLLLTLTARRGVRRG